MTKPTLDTDRRGVSEVIGSILVFGLVVMLVSLLQVQAIPNANEEVEFEHSQQVRGDFSDLQVAMDEAVDSGRSQSASVQMGVDYPSRLLFYNPPSKSGTLRTTERETMRISNVESSTDAEVFFSHSGGSVAYETRSLVYSIGYNELQNSPSDVREPAVTYRRENGVPLVSDTTLVEGRTINLVAIGGELDTGGGTSEKVEAKPISAPAKTYTIRDRNGPVTIEVPTQLSEPTWKELLADQMGPRGYVDSVSVTSGTLTVELQQNTQYTLRTSKVGFGQSAAAEPAYMVPVASEAADVASVEVRDKFNNPVTGVTLNVEFQDETGAELASTQVTTSTDGRASIERPDSGPGSNAVQVEFYQQFDDVPGFSTLESVTTSFGDDVVLTDATGSSGSDTIELELRNPGGKRNIESVQAHYITGYEGITITGVAAGTIGATNVVDGPNAVTQLAINPGGTTTFGTDPTENEGPQPPDSSLSIPGGTSTLALTFDESYSFNTGLSNDALAVRVTLYFEDGDKTTFDVMVHSHEDT